MLDVREVTRRFEDVTALDAVSFSVAPGEICGFVGRNGAGKTTAMRIILGLLDPYAGEVRWNGEPVDATARHRFGYMPEERGLYPKMRVDGHLRYLARLHGMEGRCGCGGAALDAAPRRRRSRSRPRRAAVARQPAARPGRRRPRP